MKRYGIVGDGRVARHFRHYLQILKVPCRQWSRRQEAETGEPAEAALAGCDVLLILISDDAIEQWIQSNSWSEGRTRIHFSGSLLTPLARGAHPLMSFGPGFYDRETYQSIHFITELGGPEFRGIFPALPNPVHSIRPEDKALYHALCVMAGNFSTLLWQKLFGGFERGLGLPREAALPYLKQVFANLAEHPERALTGPLQRRDLGTIAANLAALDGDPYERVYRAFVEAVAEARAPQPESCAKRTDVEQEGGTA